MWGPDGGSDRAFCPSPKKLLRSVGDIQEPITILLCAIQLGEGRGGTCHAASVYHQVEGLGVGKLKSAPTV
jgi:hypothetical protein